MIRFQTRIKTVSRGEKELPETSVRENVNDCIITLKKEKSWRRSRNMVTMMMKIVMNGIMMIDKTIISGVLLPILLA